MAMSADRTPRTPELETVIEQHAALKRLEEATRQARLDLGAALAAARAAGVPQKRIAEETGENRETLRRWERAFDDHRAAS
ncbi:hypothetical protein GCM10027294_25430 [Marinactinospora endophytica]